VYNWIGEPYMIGPTLLEPERIRVNRSALRQSQNATLAKARGRSVIAVTARGRDEKYVLDKNYFDELLARLSALQETLEIAADTRLLRRLTRASKTIPRDLRAGRLYSLEEAFGDK